MCSYHKYIVFKQVTISFLVYLHTRLVLTQHAKLVLTQHARLVITQQARLVIIQHARLVMIQYARLVTSITNQTQKLWLHLAKN